MKLTYTRDRKPTAKRNAELRRYAACHPKATLVEIGSVFGVKHRQAVARILHPVEYNERRKAKREALKKQK